MPIHRLLITLLFFFAISAHQAASQTVTLPAELKAKPGEWIRIEPTKIDGGRLSWRLDTALSEASLDTVLPDDVAGKLKIAGIDPAKLFPADALTKLKGKVLDIRPGTPAGRYRVECWTAKGDVASEIATCWIVVGDAPKPPDPGPPNPGPTPPQPTDPLTQRLQAAFMADPAMAALKRGQLALLTGLYEAMAEHAADSTIMTTGDLLSDYQMTAGKMVPAGALVALRKVVADEVAARLGTESLNLDKATRDKAVDLFKRLAAASSRVQ